MLVAGAAAILLVLAAMTFAVLTGAVGAGRFLGSWGISVVIVTSALACMARAVFVSEQRWLWVVLALGFGSYAVGTIIWSFWLQYEAEPPFPSISDPLWLFLYPCCYVALIAQFRATVSKIPSGVWLDGIIAGLAIAALGSELLYGAVTSTTSEGAAAIGVNFAYPVCDIVLVALVVSIFTLIGWRPNKTMLVIGAGFLLLGVADSVYVNQVSAGTYLPGGAANLLWSAGMAALGVAAWLPASTVGPPRVRSPAVLAPPFVFACGSVALLVYDHFANVNLLSVVLATLAVFATMIRAALSFRELGALADTRRQALTDDLTGLSNRRALSRDLTEAVESARESGEDVALVIIDLDQFKELNDSLGHHWGDLLLREIGPRLQGALGRRDVLARLGGDEFAVLLPGVDAARAVPTVERLLARLEDPFELEELELRVSASFGIAGFPGQADDSESLMRHADVAMYQAKAGPTGHAVYVAERDKASRQKLLLASGLKPAIEQHQLRLHYQPQLDPHTGDITCVEGLVRWEHPERGLLGPAEFLPPAERAGLMRPITREVAEIAISECAEWRSRGLDTRVAINLSASDVLDLQLPDELFSALARWALPPDALKLEITENIVMVDPAGVAKTLQRLQDHGIALSLDDYGTGLSSLRYLKQLPLDELKIDRSLVTNVAGDPADRAIVASTVDLAHSLGLAVVAEGVEDEVALEKLIGLGCNLVQGFHVCRPKPASEIEEWIAARSQVRHLARRRRASQLAEISTSPTPAGRPRLTQTT
jgi:diguanylate cyclase (GGDEF)-like protein